MQQWAGLGWHCGRCRAVISGQGWVGVAVEAAGPHHSLGGLHWTAASRAANQDSGWRLQQWRRGAWPVYHHLNGSAHVQRGSAVSGAAQLSRFGTVLPAPALPSSSALGDDPLAPLLTPQRSLARRRIHGPGD